FSLLQVETDNNQPSRVRLRYRILSMNPSTASSSGRSARAIPRYASSCAARGQTSKTTQNIRLLRPNGHRRLRFSVAAARLPPPRPPHVPQRQRHEKYCDKQWHRYAAHGELFLERLCGPSLRESERRS